MKVRTRPDEDDERFEIHPSIDLFDDSGGYESDRGIQVAPGLTEQERRQAVTLYRLFNELWGLIVVVGEPGAGKDTFGNWASYHLHRFFPQKPVLRDEKPRRLYGPYAGLFNDKVLANELSKMRQAASGVGATKVDEALAKAADAWVANRGQELLQDAIVYLTEMYRYCYKRDPHNPMNKTMGGIFKMKRHINALIIGTVQLVSDLDRFTCKPFIDWRVTCTRSKIDTTRYTYFVEKVEYDNRQDILVPSSKPFAIPVDAGKPRSYMGDGIIRVRRPDYLPENEEERVVLEALKMGVNRYEDLVKLLEMEGDMSEWETLTTLKELGLKLVGRRPKFVIDYPCVYHLFNSRSKPNITTSLGGS